jgi:hypothetical protein
MKLSTFPAIQWHALKAIQPAKQQYSPMDASFNLGQSSLLADTFQPASANVRSGVNAEEPLIKCANYLKGLGEEKEKTILQEVKRLYRDSHNTVVYPRKESRMDNDLAHINLYVERILLPPLCESFLDLNRSERDDSVILKQLAAIVYTWGNTKKDLKYSIINSRDMIDHYDALYDDYFEEMVSDLFRTLGISKQSPEHRLLVIMIGSLKDQVLKRRDYVPKPNPAPTMVFPKTAGQMETLMELVYGEDYYEYEC